MPPVGIILIKADLFSHDTGDEEFREILQESFSPLSFSRYTQVGVIPVTLGENMKHNREMFQLYLNQIMWFVNGRRQVN